MRLCGAAHQGGHRGGRQPRRRRGIRRRGGRGARGRHRPPAELRHRVLGRRQTGGGGAAVAAAVGGVQKPVRCHHGRRRGPIGGGSVPGERQAEDGGGGGRPRQVHRAKAVLAFGQLLPRAARRPARGHQLRREAYVVARVVIAHRKCVRGCSSTRVSSAAARFAGKLYAECGRGEERRPASRRPQTAVLQRTRLWYIPRGTLVQFLQRYTDNPERADLR